MPWSEVSPPYSNLANNLFASACVSRRPNHLLRYLPFAIKFMAFRKFTLIVSRLWLGLVFHRPC